MAGLNGGADEGGGEDDIAEMIEADDKGAHGSRAEGG